MLNTTVLQKREACTVARLLTPWLTISLKKGSIKRASVSIESPETNIKNKTKTIPLVENAVIDPFEEKLKNKKLAEESDALKKSIAVNSLDQDLPVFDISNAKNSLKLKRPAIELEFMASIEDKPIKLKDNE